MHEAMIVMITWRFVYGVIPPGRGNRIPPIKIKRSEVFIDVSRAINIISGAALQDLFINTKNVDMHQSRHSP